jgi:AraC-like DNA-binding protein
MDAPNTPAKNPGRDDLPAVTVVEISDPTAASEGIEVIGQDVVQLQTEPLRVQRVIVRLDPSVVVYQSTNLPVRSRTRILQGMVGFVAFGPEAAGTLNGVPVRPDLLLAGGPGSEGEFVVKAGYESVAIFLPPAIFREHIEIRRPGDPFRVPEAVEVLQANSSAARTLFDRAKGLTDVAAQHPHVFDERPASRAAAHAEILDALLEAMGSSKDHEPTRKERTRQGHSQIVQIAEEYVTTHTEERVSVTDLCKVADVSERTLQYAFQEVTGMTPIAFLTRLRLHRVRQALREATHRTTTVSAEALRWGFWHFGDFSQAYKNCFRELPSETLKR